MNRVAESPTHPQLRPRGGVRDWDVQSLETVFERVDHAYWLFQDQHDIFGVPGELSERPMSEAAPLAFLPACHPASFGSQVFRQRHGLRFAYLGGAMANGIASVELVETLARHGMLGFFGSAGLSLERIQAAIEQLQARCAGQPYGFNLIHSPNEPHHEQATVDLYLSKGVRLVEASAYLDLTLPLVHYRVAGIHQDAEGRVVTPQRIVAKASREEVARKFLEPPPEKLLDKLVARGVLTAAQKELARRIPVADDLTAEADSGGHTDNRPALALLPTFLALRDQIQRQFAYREPICVGLGGGLGAPAAVSAAWALGAEYVLTGSINQACVESGSCDTVRRMLAEAQQADVIMAPAADMFEMGVKVQVLKRGTLFPMRAAKLYTFYREYPALEALPAEERQKLETQLFRAPLEQIWRETEVFFQKREPRQLDKARQDPHHKMALVFRWYLGLSSRWANAGEPTRVLDYQIWCGPALGAFNAWTAGTFLAEPSARRAALVALNLLYGAAQLGRVQALRGHGLQAPLEQLQGVARPRAMNGLEWLVRS